MSFALNDPTVPFFGNKTLDQHTVFLRGGQIYSSPTHASLPCPPDGPTFELNARGLNSRTMLSPQYATGLIQHLPFVLTHFSAHDSLLGSLVWSTRNGDPFYSGEEGRWYLREDLIAEWKDLENLITYASQTIFSACGRYSFPLEAVTFPRSIRDIKFDLPAESHKQLCGRVYAARDSLLLEAALLSWTISLYHKTHYSSQNGWYDLLLCRGIPIAAADRIRSSSAAQFSPQIRRVGMFLHAYNIPDAIFNFLFIYTRAHIPIWISWAPGPNQLRVAFQKYKPLAANIRTAITAEWTVWDSNAYRLDQADTGETSSIRVSSSWTPNSFVPPITQEEALVHTKCGWEHFLQRKQEDACALWPTLSRPERQRILSRLYNVSRCLITGPSDMNARLFVWGQGDDWACRTQVVNSEAIKFIWEAQEYTNRIIYDPLKNEFDACLKFNPDTLTFRFRNELMAPAPASTPEDELALSELPFEPGTFEEPLVDETGPSAHETLTTHISTIQDPGQCNETFSAFLKISPVNTNLHLTARASMVTIWELVQLSHGLRVDPLPEQPIDSTEWDLVRFFWGCPPLEIPDIHTTARACALLDMTKKLNEPNLRTDAISGLLAPIPSLHEYLQLRVYTPSLSDQQRQQSGQLGSHWYLFTGNIYRDTTLVAYDAVTARYCISSGASDVLGLAKTLGVRGFRFSLRVTTEHPKQCPTAAATVKSVLSSLDEYRLKVTLGWRTDTHVYTPEEFEVFLDKVRIWCEEYPERARCALREGGLIWRLVSCFVNPMEAAYRPSDDRYGMPDEFWIVDGDTCLLDDHLLDEEKNFLMGVYEAYHAGEPDCSKSAKMSSWFPRWIHWNGSACDKKMWTEEAEAFWEERVSECRRQSARPHNVETWRKTWIRGHNHPEDLDRGYSKYRQTGSRQYRSTLKVINQCLELTLVSLIRDSKGVW